MSFVSAVNSLYFTSSGGATPNIEEVLNTGSDAGGQPLTGITNLNVSEDVQIARDASVGRDLVVGTEITTPLLSSQTVSTIQANIGSRLYPIVGVPVPSNGLLGSIRVNTFAAPVDTNSGTYLIDTFNNIKAGFYCGKVEIDFTTSVENVVTTAEIDVSQGTPLGSNIGFSLGLIKGGATVSTVIVPFFFYSANDTVINIRYGCVITGGGTWRGTTESDIDLFRVF